MRKPAPASAVKHSCMAVVNASGHIHPPSDVIPNSIEADLLEPLIARDHARRMLFLS
jgi:hypothetical protein